MININWYRAILLLRSWLHRNNSLVVQSIVQYPDTNFASILYISCYTFAEYMIFIWSGYVLSLMDNQKVFSSFKFAFPVFLIMKNINRNPKHLYITNSHTTAFLNSSHLIYTHKRFSWKQKSDKCFVVLWWCGLRLKWWWCPKITLATKSNSIHNENMWKKHIFQNLMSFSFFIKLFMYYKKEKKALIILVRDIFLLFAKCIKNVKYHFQSLSDSF